MREVVIDKMPIGITNLYDIVAEKLGHDPSKCHYNCTKIEVSENIAQAIEDCYNDGTSDWKMTFGMHWCCFGPKEDKTLPDNTVRIEEGFIE